DCSPRRVLRARRQFQRFDRQPGFWPGAHGRYHGPGAAVTSAAAPGRTRQTILPASSGGSGAALPRSAQGLIMQDRWQYQRISGEPDLDRLGSEGWELVAIRGEEWILKRPAPDPAERFTLEQRTAALSTPPAGHAPGRHLLNPQIAALIRQVNHTQMLLIADRGFPVPTVPVVVDVSLTADIPTILQVLAAILPDLPADRLIVAQEQQALSPNR